MHMHVFLMGYEYIHVFLCGECASVGAVYIHMCTSFLGEQMRFFRSPGLGVTDFCELPDLVVGTEFRS